MKAGWKSVIFGIIFMILLFMAFYSSNLLIRLSGEEPSNFVISMNIFLQKAGPFIVLAALILWFFHIYCVTKGKTLKKSIKSWMMSNLILVILFFIPFLIVSIYLIEIAIDVEPAIVPFAILQLLAIFIGFAAGIYILTFLFLVLMKKVFRKKQKP